MRVWLYLLAAGCFSPRTPSGVICDPLAPACPDGQVCRPEGTGHVCKEPGVDVDARSDDVPPDAPFAYLSLEAGWSASVFHDFSAAFTYSATDWMEETEIHDNQPSYGFGLYPPFGDGLGVIAGRRILTLDGTSVGVHDFGMHLPNTTGLADHLTAGVFVPGTTPVLLVASGSEDTGDGLFVIDATWNIAHEIIANNSRAVIHDPTGAFDARGSAESYLGGLGGVVRRSDQLVVVTGDMHSMRLVGTTLYATRRVAATGMHRLVRIASGTHAETALHESTRIEIGDGDAPAGFDAWAIIDYRQLVVVAPGGMRRVIAELLDPGWQWHHVIVPPADHPLAGRVYILESHRAQDIDRVIALRFQ